MKKSKRALTLVEMLMVMALIVMTISIVGYNGLRMIQQQQFLSGSALVLDRLQQAQNIMLIFGCDTHVTIDWDEERTSFFTTLTPEKQLPISQPEKIFGLQPLSGINRITFNEEEELPLTLSFSSLSRQTPRGQLQLEGHSDSQTLNLYGYPRPIRWGEATTFDDEQQNIQPYPEAIQIALAEKKSVPAP